MILNLGSLAFNCGIQNGGGTPAWGTELGQGEGYKFSFEDTGDFLSAMLYCAIPDIAHVTCPLGKGGQQAGDYEFVVASIFNKVFVNGVRVSGGKFMLLIVKKLKGTNHVGRRSIKYNPNMTYNGEYINRDCYRLMEHVLNLNNSSAWFVHEITTKNQDELHFSAFVLNKEKEILFDSSEQRKIAFISSLGTSTEIRTAQHLHPIQKIYFGTPGSGKSYRVKEDTAGHMVFRTTFHPDSDYSTFVGSYKPEKEGEKITYTFVPQAFTAAYIEAYKEPGKDVYLIIEEINRGNCAQIFGDLFQLLDRNDIGESEYPITPDKDLADYITSELRSEDNENECDGLIDGKLKLPSNLNIIATMNTSDQSLFHMDSAFKRRWEWEYVPIDYSNMVSSGFTITIGAYKFSWIEFLKAVNERIRRVTESEDKQLGNFFIKSSIDEDDFKSKVMFYLWSEVCKDEYMTEQNFMRSISEKDRKELDNMPESILKSNTDEYETEEFSFNDLFTGRGTDLLLGFMYSLNVLPHK